MKVTITTPFARLQVDLTAERAAALMDEALCAAAPRPKKTMEEAMRELMAHPNCRCAVLPVTVPEPDEAPAEDEVPTADDAGPSMEPQKSPVPEPDKFAETTAGFSAEEPTPEKGDRGFLHIKCDECHKERSFHMKWPIKEYRCECGHTQPLHGLSKILAKCDCGWELKYYTNQGDDSFEMTCPNCGEKILVKWNFRHKRYELAD